MFEKIELGAFMFRESWSDLNLVLLKSTWCFCRQIFCCFDPLSSCLSKELIHTPFFFNYSSVLPILLKKKKSKPPAAPNQLSSPAPGHVLIFLDSAWPVDWMAAQHSVVWSLRCHVMTTPGSPLGTLLLCCCLPASNSIWPC